MSTGRIREKRIRLKTEGRSIKKRRGEEVQANVYRRERNLNTGKAEPQEEGRDRSLSPNRRGILKEDRGVWYQGSFATFGKDRNINSQTGKKGKGQG